MFNEDIRGSFFTKVLSISIACLMALAGTGLYARPAQAQQATVCQEYYTVAPGDTLGEIAGLFDTSVQTLAQINNLQNPDVLFPGQQLCVNFAQGELIVPPASGGIIIPNTGGGIVIPNTGGIIIPNTGGGIVIPNTGGGILIPNTGGAAQIVPGLAVTSVVEGQSVTVQGTNFPSNVTFNVLMGPAATQGINGIFVDTINTGSGTFSETFAIPAILQNLPQIVVRLQSPNTNYLAISTFDNVTAGTPGGGGPLVTAPAFEQRVERTQTRDVNLGETVDFSLGNAGLFLPNSNYPGEITLRRLNSSSSQPVPDLNFTQQWLEVIVTDQSGSRQPAAEGLNYVYFNLDANSRAAWDSGNLGIYRYSPELLRWQECPFPVLFENENQPWGRLACTPQQLGVFGLAITP